MDVNELAKFHILRYSSRNSKNLLMFMEDLKTEQDDSLNKLKENIPAEYHNLIDQYNIFTENRVKHIRKRILDLGGDFSREMLSELDNYNIRLK